MGINSILWEDVIYLAEFVVPGQDLEHRGLDWLFEDAEGSCVEG